MLTATTRHWPRHSAPLTRQRLGWRGCAGIRVSPIPTPPTIGCTARPALTMAWALNWPSMPGPTRWKPINAVEAKKRDTCPTFGLRWSIRYDARTYRLMSLDRVSLNTSEGRVICHLLLGARQHCMLVDPEWKIGGADLVWRAGVYYLHVT